MAETILVTGATGYIGSHTCVCLLKAGWRVVAVDNLSNSSVKTIDRIQRICRQELPFHLIDVRDESALMRLLSQENISAAIHFAGLKSVSESVSKPLDYYDNNVNGSIMHNFIDSESIS
jgi:UDP-glucose 4-epimerase